MHQPVYHPRVKTDDIPRLGAAAAMMVRRAIEARLLVDPVRYGLPLRRGLKGYRKLRVGDYRIIYRIVGAGIRIVIIGHRKDVYARVGQRLH